MSFYRFSEDEVKEILNRLDRISLELKQSQRTQPEEIWYDNQQFLNIMNVSKRTAAYWRTENIITYVQVGNKIYYRLNDILELLSKCTVPAKNTNQNPKTDGNKYPSDQHPS